MKTTKCLLGYLGDTGDPEMSIPGDVGTHQRFINLTPHEVNIGDLDFEPSGLVARVNVNHREVGQHAGVTLLVGTYGEVSALPEESEGLLYIVSAAVRTALPERKDLASPAHLVRDDEGRIVGCLALEINA